MTISGMANPMSQMNSYYPGAAAAYSSLSAASMAAAAAAAAAQQNAIAGLANSNSQQVKIPLKTGLFYTHRSTLLPSTRL